MWLQPPPHGRAPARRLRRCCSLHHAARTARTRDSHERSPERSAPTSALAISRDGESNPIYANQLISDGARDFLSTKRPSEILAFSSSCLSSLHPCSCRLAAASRAPRHEARLAGALPHRLRPAHRTLRNRKYRPCNSISITSSIDLETDSENAFLRCYRVQAESQCSLFRQPSLTVRVLRAAGGHSAVQPQQRKKAMGPDARVLIATELGKAEAAPCGAAWRLLAIRDQPG